MTRLSSFLHSSLTLTLSPYWKTVLKSTIRCFSRCFMWEVKEVLIHFSMFLPNLQVIPASVFFITINQVFHTSSIHIKLHEAYSSFLEFLPLRSILTSTSTEMKALPFQLPSQKRSKSIYITIKYDRWRIIYLNRWCLKALYDIDKK